MPSGPRTHATLKWRVARSGRTCGTAIVGSSSGTLLADGIVARPGGPGGSDGPGTDGTRGRSGPGSGTGQRSGSSSATTGAALRDICPGLGDRAPPERLSAGGRAGRAGR